FLFPIPCQYTMSSSPEVDTVPTFTLRPPSSDTVIMTTVPNPRYQANTVPLCTVSRPATAVVRSSLRQQPTVTRSASVTIVEDERVRITARNMSEDMTMMDKLHRLLNVESDATVLSRVQSLTALEQEYCSQLVATHEKQKALDRALADARQAAAQQRLRARIDCKEREMDALARRAARVDAFNRDVLARVAIRTAAHSDAEKRILRSRIEQQSRQIRDLEKQLRDARTTR
ncbi:hypothetical protein PMAYCL1PPCAC_08809, partial [Pristionchus mayeri]